METLSSKQKKLQGYHLHNEHFKVTVHVGTDQNIEIEIFAEDKCTLNELLTKIVFQYV